MTELPLVVLVRDLNGNTLARAEVPWGDHPVPMMVEGSRLTPGLSQNDPGVLVVTVQLDEAARDEALDQLLDVAPDLPPMPSTGG